MYSLTSRDDLSTPLFRKRVAIGLALVLGTYLFSVLFPQFALGALLVLFLVLLPGSSFPYDIIAELMGPMLIGVSMGSEWHKYSLGFDLAVAVSASLVTSAMGILIARYVIRDMAKHDAKNSKRLRS